MTSCLVMIEGGGGVHCEVEWISTGITIQLEVIFERGINYL